MEKADKLFAGPIPEIYDTLLVPLIFEPYAEELADRAAALRPLRVLEIAAGTGALTRALADRLDSAAIVATDLNPPMLERAAMRQSDNARIQWRQADAQDLPFEDGSFDLVVCQFGVMFFPDKRRAYEEARRVLLPAGRYLFNAWDVLARNEFAWTVSEALVGLFSDDPPRFMERTPHGYHDVAAIRADLTAAGFTEIDIETVTHTSRARSAEEVAVAFCQGTPMRAEIEARAPPNLSTATRTATEALERRFGGQRIEGGLSAHVVSAVRR